MKNIVFIIILTLLTGISYSQSLESVITSAINGSEVKFYKYDGHEFHIKPVHILHSPNGKIYAKGQISHCLSFRPDDQVYYTIEIYPDNGYYVKSVKIVRGGFSSLILNKSASEFMQYMGRLFDGKWEEASAEIIDAIGWMLSENF